MQGYRGERPAVVAEPADELTGEVLRLGGTAPVATRQKSPAGAEDTGQLHTPARDGGGGAGVACGCVRQVEQVILGRVHGHRRPPLPDSGRSGTSASTGARAHTAATTSSGRIESRQGCPGTGQMRARLLPHGAS